MLNEVELALGTVQFGTTYGVAGRGEPVPAHEARAILRRAADFGIRVLDTAPLYGDIEERLADLAGDFGFSIVSKISGVPRDVSEGAAAELVAESVRRSRDRLGDRLSTLLFHRGEDLLGPNGRSMWQAAQTAGGAESVRLGASCYSPSEAIQIRERFSVAVVQLPGNVLDQRLAEGTAATRLAAVEIHIRSAFLQGLLLLPVERAAARLPKAAKALDSWARWCADRGAAPLRAALGAVKTLPGVRYCVVGVDRLSHLEEIVEAWQTAEPVNAATLACLDEEVIDPRRWTVA